MHRAKKKRVARAFAVITAVLLLLLFIARDILRENWKDTHDSLAQAEALYEIHNGQNDMPVRSEEQFAESLPNRPHDPKIPSDLRAKAANDLKAKAGNVLVEAQDELYLVSELIDALPSGASDLRKQNHDSSGLLKLRDEHRTRLEQDISSWTALPPDVEDPEGQRMALDAYKTAYTEHQEILWLGVLVLGQLSTN